MTEPEQAEFHERVVAGDRRANAGSLPVRAGVVMGTAALIVIGAVSAMGASPPATTDGQPNLSTAAANRPETDVASPFANGFRGGLGRAGLHEITIAAINGSNLSLQTADGWTRTIAVGSATTITKAGETIALADLAVGDRIGFAQVRQSDGSFTITAIKVVLPVIGGEVTAVEGSTITVTGKDGTSGTIHVDGDTTFEVDGEDAAISDIEVGDFVVAEGSLRTDGSLDADRIHGGMHGPRGGFPGRGFHDRFGEPVPAPTPVESGTTS